MKEEIERLKVILNNSRKPPISMVWLTETAENIYKAGYRLPPSTVGEKSECSYCKGTGTEIPYAEALSEVPCHICEGTGLATPQSVEPELRERIAEILRIINEGDYPSKTYLEQADIVLSLVKKPELKLVDRENEILCEFNDNDCK
jgi:DnaJ-class molecular chaperone